MMIIGQNGTNREKSRSGFTLMEILIVAAIIAVLAGAGGYHFLQSFTDSKVDLAVVHMKSTLQHAVEAYEIDHGEYPNRLEDLLAPSSGRTPYLQKADSLLDPWGHPYQIGPPPQGHVVPTIYTDGPDGRISNYSENGHTNSL